MRKTNANTNTLLAVVDELLTKSFPSRVIDGREYFIIPRTYWGKLGLTPRQIDRIFEKLRKFGLIHTTVKQHEGKPTLHVHIVAQDLHSVEILATGKAKHRKNQKSQGFHQKQNWKSPQTKQLHGFHQCANIKESEKPENSRFSPISSANKNSISISTFKSKSIERENKERSAYTQQKPELQKLRGELIRAGLPEGAVNYVLRRAQKNEWLLKNLVCLVNSKYFLEGACNRLAIVLALARNPARYNFLNLKTAGEGKNEEMNALQVQRPVEQHKNKLQLTRQQLEHLAAIRAVLEKFQTREEIINFVLKKAVLNVQHLDRLVEFMKTDYFSQRVENKAAFMIAFLNCPDRFEMPNQKENKTAKVKNRKHEKIIHEVRPAETYICMEKLYKEYLKNNNKEDDLQVLKELGIPVDGTISRELCEPVCEDEEDVFEFLGIPKPKSA